MRLRLRVVLRLDPVGADGQRLQIVRHRVRIISLSRERLGEVILGQDVILRNRRRAAEQRHAVAPVSQLHRRCEQQEQQDCGCGRSKKKTWPRPFRPAFRKAPRRHDKNANQRNIGVAIRHELEPNLHQADHRHQRSQKPEPAHRQMRSRAPLRENRAGDRQQEQSRRRCLPERPRVRIRVKHREVGRPHGFPEIERITHQRIGDAVGNR